MYQIINKIKKYNTLISINTSYQIINSSKTLAKNPEFTFIKNK